MSIMLLSPGTDDVIWLLLAYTTLIVDGRDGGFWYFSLCSCFVSVLWCLSFLSLSIRSLGSVVTRCMTFNNSLFSFLELCPVEVLPAAVACVIDAMVCICVGSFVHAVWSSEWAPKFLYLHTGMCIDGIVLLQLNLVPSSSHSLYTSTKFEFKWHTASFVFYINAEYQGMMCPQNCVLCSKYAPQIFHNCHTSYFLQYFEFQV